MQDAKEDSPWSLKTIKKKARDWWTIHGKLWTKRFIEYIILILLVAFLFGYLFARFDLYHTDPDSARYMLSAMVQAQAAIVAIVVTLTLVAVQLTASAYSPRVIRIFRDNPDMWILLLFYVVSILYGLLVLKMIRAGDLREISLFGSYLEYHIFSAYIAVAFTFFMLFPYMWNIINLLNPATIINRLATEITKDTLITEEEDPIQPIIDIVHGAIMKYDIATTRVGLRAVTDRAIELIDSDNDEKISKLFCDHLKRVCRLALSRSDEESAEVVIKNLEKFGKSLAEKRIDHAVNTVAWSLKLIETNALEKRAENVATAAVESLGEIGKTANEKGAVRAAIDVAKRLASAAEDAMDQSVERTARRAVGYLGKIGSDIANDRTSWRITIVAMCFYHVGIIAVDKGFVKLAESLARRLAELTLRNEESVKTALLEDASKLEGKNRDSFQKFMELHDQELERLRAEQKNSKADAASKSESKSEKPSSLI